ncbi:hypothetical protein BAnh1_09070 [Bartonella australis AUST/NH1]|uniref:Uncharacterized protein n=1 Tax=Bartonella australis (strain Aust/NH1) TaxID=1094489 RepID=M1P4J7_BARAA|nr:hypothetical protein [Bartonella australis]AGF74780.1 hypothetical protein BAnh1_09070 [Bartonella australis AUST/NH1]
MLIQSILSFILGVSVTAWLLVLVAPLIWRRALYFARQIVSAKIPLSLTEMQANKDFLCAQHAVELTHHKQKYDALQKKYAQQKIQLSRVKKQLYQFVTNKQCAHHPLPETETTAEEDEQDVIVTRTFAAEIETMREKMAHYQRRLQKIKIDELDVTSSNQLLSELREETKELAATLAAQIAMKEGKDSPIDTLTKNSEDGKDLASYIRKKIACSSETPSTKRS